MAFSPAQTMSSATGLLSLLDESEVALQIHALQRLNEVVDQFWSVDARIHLAESESHAVSRLKFTY